MAMTITEKILAKASGKEKVSLVKTYGLMSMF
jgi:hypothetical protein